ncbi:MAG: hypothetical protein S4CHLAM20_03890 [Chlamydiia bacterium]|nr:hypothetical protein [Chlamydiia bacterium]
MSDINPTDPPKGKPPGPTPPGNQPGSGTSGYKPFVPSGNGMDAFKKWLGPKKYAEFIRTLCQSITTRIQQMKKAQDLAARKLKASAEGKDPDDVTE